MSNNITILTADVKDALVVHQLINALEETNTNFKAFEDIYLHNLQKTTVIYFVAKVNDTVVGFISAHGQLLLHHLGYVYEIQELYVLDDYRGFGIGKALVSKIERVVKDKHAVSLEVTTQKKRTKAHEFYNKNEFIGTHFKFTKQL
jgi:PhnO protein